MVSNNTNTSFSDGLGLSDDARCTFTGCGAVNISQPDETRSRDGEVFLRRYVMQAALEAEEVQHLHLKGLDVDGVSLSFFGDGWIMFNAWNQETKSYSNVVITADDVRKVLAVFDGGPVH